MNLFDIITKIIIKIKGKGHGRSIKENAKTNINIL